MREILILIDTNLIHGHSFVSLSSQTVASIASDTVSEPALLYSFRPEFELET